MTSKIIEAGQDKYKVRCYECGCIFQYEREDVRPNYVRGGEEQVSCPHCGHNVRHLGAP